MAYRNHSVTINLYDLSGGMAKMFSPMFLQKQIDGIWHTGFVVYGKEFYYGGGICSGQPKQTPYGTPVQSIDMGDTQIPEEVFTEFLRDISDKFSMDKYDLFKNNCNDFTDESIHFLTGSHIPNFITGLPQEVLNTPMGQMIKPLVDKMQQQVATASGQSALFPSCFEGLDNSQAIFNTNNNSMSKNNNDSGQQQYQQQGLMTSAANLFDRLNEFNYGTSNAVATQKPPATGSSSLQASDMKKVIEIIDLNDFFIQTDGQEAVVIDFYADQSEPCKIIKPIFAELSEQFPNIKFVSVNAEKNKNVAAQFGVTTLPTFITLHDGDIVSTWKGANYDALKTNLCKLDAKIK